MYSISILDFTQDLSPRRAGSSLLLPLPSQQGPTGSAWCSVNVRYRNDGVLSFFLPCLSSLECKIAFVFEEISLDFTAIFPTFLRVHFICFKKRHLSSWKLTPCLLTVLRLPLWLLRFCFEICPPHWPLLFQSPWHLNSTLCYWQHVLGNPLFALVPFWLFSLHFLCWCPSALRWWAQQYNFAFILCSFLSVLSLQYLSH